MSNISRCCSVNFSKSGLIGQQNIMCHCTIRAIQFIKLCTIFKSKLKCFKKITAFRQNTMDLLSKILAFLSEASVGNKINNQVWDELCQLARHTFFFLHLCQVVFLRGHLPVRCSSCEVYFLRGCLLVRLYSC